MSRTDRISVLILALLFFLSIPLYFGYVQRKRALITRQRVPVLQATTQQAAPLLGAIKAYQAKQGKPPASLQALVPAYLKSLPAAGPLAQGGWRYEVGTRPTAGGWSLYVVVNRRYSDPNGFGDMFVYHPSGQYAQADYGGTRERVGAWAYYHE